MAKKTKPKSKMEKAISIARLAEKNAGPLNEKLTRQIRSLSIICDCLDFRDAQFFLLSVHDLLKEQTKKTKQKYS